MEPLTFVHSTSPISAKGIIRATTTAARNISASGLPPLSAFQSWFNPKSVLGQVRIVKDPESLDYWFKVV